MKKAAGFALIKTIPVFLGYIFLGIAFGLLLQKAGLGAGWAFLISLFVYAGSMQFALVGILTRRAEFYRNSHHDAFDQQPTRILWPDLY